MRPITSTTVVASTTTAIDGFHMDCAGMKDPCEVQIPLCGPLDMSGDAIEDLCIYEVDYNCFNTSSFQQVSNVKFMVIQYHKLPNLICLNSVQYEIKIVSCRSNIVLRFNDIHLVN